jgi:hypothetical protein
MYARVPADARMTPNSAGYRLGKIPDMAREIRVHVGTGPDVVQDGLRAAGPLGGRLTERADRRIPSGEKAQYLAEVLLQFFERTCPKARASCGRQISSQKSIKVATLRGASRLDGRIA